MSAREEVAAQARWSGYYITQPAEVCAGSQSYSEKGGAGTEDICLLQVVLVSHGTRLSMEFGPILKRDGLFLISDSPSLPRENFEVDYKMCHWEATLQDSSKSC